MDGANTSDEVMQQRRFWFSVGSIYLFLILSLGMRHELQHGLGLAAGTESVLFGRRDRQVVRLALAESKPRIQ
jgi:hypothetical protein